MSNIYLASSWRNKMQPDVVKLLRLWGHTVYDFREPVPGQSGFKWEDIDPQWQSWTATSYARLVVSHPVAQLGFQRDFQAMIEADTCVLLLPCGRSAHLEAGWFCGKNKRCIILTQDGEEPELMNCLASYIVVGLDALRSILNPN